MRAAILIVVAAILVTPAASTPLATSALPERQVGYDDSPLDWSPDGRIVYSHVFDAPPTSIYAPVVRIAIMNQEGSGKRLLARKDRPPLIEQWDSEARWSPDGAWVAFARYIGLQQNEIYVVHPDGTGLRNLTTTDTLDEVAPAWAPESKTIAFTRAEAGTGNGIWLVSPDGTGMRQLTHGDDDGAVWSPDGQSIAFTRLRGEAFAGFTVRIDGTGLTRVTGWGGDLGIDQWSPDGRFLLYEGNGPDDRPFVRRVRPDGTGRRALVRGMNAAWSPDGRRLLFAADRGRYPHVKAVLFLGDALGRRAHMVFSGAKSGIWSPDGTHVALPSTGPCNGSGVFVLRVATRNARWISNDCRVLGTARSDRLLGTRERDLIWGHGGNDFIDASPGNPKPLWETHLDHNFVDGGPGNDRIYGRRGRDVLIGGPGRDYVSGGGQNDRINLHDGQVDFVHCGPGTADWVYADTFDLVAPDCERVLRR